MLLRQARRRFARWVRAMALMSQVQELGVSTSTRSRAARSSRSGSTTGAPRMTTAPPGSNAAGLIGRQPCIVLRGLHSPRQGPRQVVGVREGHRQHSPPYGPQR